MSQERSLGSPACDGLGMSRLPISQARLTGDLGALLDRVGICVD
jgi:hypothetical protein